MSGAKPLPCFDRHVSPVVPLDLLPAHGAEVPRRVHRSARAVLVPLVQVATVHGVLVLGDTWQPLVGRLLPVAAGVIVIWLCCRLALFLGLEGGGNGGEVGRGGWFMGDSYLPSRVRNIQRNGALPQRLS